MDYRELTTRLQFYTLRLLSNAQEPRRSGAEIVRHRVVNGDEAGGRSSVHRYVEVEMRMGEIE